MIDTFLTLVCCIVHRQASTLHNPFVAGRPALFRELFETSRLRPLRPDRFPTSAPSLNLHNAPDRMHPEKDRERQSLSKRQLALSWSQDDLISTFKQTPDVKPNLCAVTGFVYPSPSNPIAYVKFGFTEERRAEARNQEYAFNALKKMPPNQT